MGYRYNSAAIIDPVMRMPSTEDLATSLDGAPGSRLPHRWVSPGVSTLDLNESGFAVVTGPNGDDWRAAARKVAAELGIDLRTAALAEEMSAAVGVGERGAILIRPDGFIAWRTDGNADSETLGRVLKTITARAR